ncbi:MAG TPA: HAMP domain-containing sensor histidine kinase [Myxococcaceae bacterium]
MQPLDVSWLVRLRWAAALLFLLLALAARAVFHIPVPLLAVGVVWGLQILTNVALAVRVRRHRTVRTTTVFALMALDTLLLTVLLALSGGPGNPFSVLYLVDVALGAVVLTSALTWALLGLVLLCFGALFLPMPWSPAATLGHADLMRLHLRGMWVAFALAGCTLVAFVLRVRRALAEREAELSRERERAQRRDRLASLATLAAGTAHALGSPLSTIAVAAHELERRLQSLPEAAEDARLIRTQVERCREALAWMSTEAGQSPGEMLHPQPVSLLLDEALEGLPEPERVLIELQEGVREATAALPVRAVGQSVQALVRNALQASPPGRPVLLRLGLDGDRLRVEVEDQGEGMAPEVLARAGEPFFSTRGSGHGLGLGLFVARSLAEQLGGDLSLVSVREEGTRARLTVPLAPAS